MKYLIYIITGSIIIGLLFMTFGCGGNSNAEENQEKELAVPVEVATVYRGDIAARFQGAATLEAEEETEVVAKVSGVVKEILVEEGDLVSQTQALAKLDDEKISVQVQQAAANLAKLKNQFIRSKELYEKELVSTEEFQSIKCEYEAQQAAYNLTKLDLQYTSIHSPINGVITQRLIKKGNMVLTNQNVFKVVDLDPLLAVLYVPEKEMTKLKVNQPADLTFDALPGKAFKGYIKRISPVVDPETGTVKVTIQVRDKSGQLKPGMFARVNIIHDLRSNVILAPKNSIISEDRNSKVFVVQDSMALQKFIELGYMNTSHVQVISGLQSGDLVVTTGKASLKDSTRVDPIPISDNKDL